MGVKSVYGEEKSSCCRTRPQGRKGHGQEAYSRTAQRVRPQGCTGSLGKAQEALNRYERFTLGTNRGR
jgi:hypothetical protein